MTPQTEKKVRAMFYIMKTNDSFIILDRESTSTQPNIHYGKITEISAIKIKNGKCIDKFDTLVDPEIKIPKKITELTGISNEMCEGKPKINKVLTDFLVFCEDLPVIGHNVDTDIRFIDYFARRMGQAFSPPFIDTLTLARYIHRKDATFKKFNLEHLFECYKLSVKGEEGQHHRALYDVMMTFELYKKLKKQLTSEIYHATLEDYEKFFGAEIIKETDDLKKLEVRNYNLWRKDVGGKCFSRLYIKLYYNNEYNDVFYDFITGQWGIKGELHGILPCGYENVVMQKIAEKRNIPVKLCYQEVTYRKGV